MYPYDELFMLRCIELSQESVDNGDDAFGCLIARGGTLIAEGRNNHRNNIAEHAEVVALQTARMALNTIDLSDCTLYTSCEPCPMCSFMIREYKIKRVLFALPSPYVGGYSRWPILQDTVISKLTPIYADPPEIIGGFMEAEAKKVMEQTRLWMFGSEIKV